MGNNRNHEQSTKEIFKVVYQSRTEDGKVFCESEDFPEVETMSRGKRVEYFKLVTLLVRGPWKPMTPEEVLAHGVQYGSQG